MPFSQCEQLANDPMVAAEPVDWLARHGVVLVLAQSPWNSTYTRYARA